MEKVYILDALRTPLGNFGGSLKNIGSVELGTILIKELKTKNNINADKVDGVVMGNVLQAGQGQNPARQCAIKGGLSSTTPSFTVNKVCGSGLKAIDIAAKEISLGFGNIYIAGGTESMSKAPYLLNGSRWGYKMGDRKVIDSILTDGLYCPYNNMHMGSLVDQMAKELKISRTMQDNFSFESHQKAIRSQDEGRFRSETIAVERINGKGIKSKVLMDEHPRRDTNMEALSRLKPAFSKDGTVTAGNASGINDGAATLVLSSKFGIDMLKVNPLAEIISISEVSGDPKYFGLMPEKAIKKVLAMSGLKFEDIKLIELNEAFAAQSIAVIHRLKVDKDIINVNGGAVALGHPIGASGARIVVTLIHEMIKRGIEYGLASLCIGSGEGMAIILRRL